MVVIGIDPGTACGWAVLDEAGMRLDSGVWDLKSKRTEGGGMRYLRARRRFARLIEQWQRDAGGVVLAYEEVRRHAGTSAAHVYGGLTAVLQATCEARGVPYRSVPVGTVKMHATGKGNAGKAAMMDAAAERWGPLALASDDEADALWIADVLRMELVGGGR